MKSLYDNNFRYTPEADEIATNAFDLLKPLFDKWVNLGYSPREISHLVQGQAFEFELEAVLTKEQE